MRFSAKDRRIMERRLKDRIPAACRAGVRRAPRYALMVAATIVLSPEAWAKVRAREAEAVFTVTGEKKAERNEYTKVYTKEELSKTLPKNPLTTLDERILTEVTQLFRRITANQKKKDQRETLEKLRSTEPDPETYKMHLAALKEPPKGRDTNPQSVAMYMTGELSNAVSDQVKSEIDLFQELNSGLDFDMDLAKLFSSSDGGAKPRSGKVRYGLVLKEIVPDKKAPKRAATSAMGHDLEYAGHADVEWTIGPVAEPAGEKLFNLRNYAAVKPEAPKKESLWSRIKLPKPGFKGRATPQNLGNIAKVDGDNLPQWKIEIDQVEGLYQLDYYTKPDGEKITAEHTVKVPVAGTVELGRRFNDNFEVVQTSAYNILYDKRLPLVSIHYMNIEERYSGSVGKKFDGHAVSVAVRGKAKGVVADEATRPETYSLKYTTRF
jgi:hypothetical protein